MKQQKFIYKVVPNIDELERILNTVNTEKIMANVIELGDMTYRFLIVWED